MKGNELLWKAWAHVIVKRAVFSDVRADVAGWHYWRGAALLFVPGLTLRVRPYVINFCFQTSSQLHGWIRLQQSLELFPSRILVFSFWEPASESLRPHQRVQTDLKSIDVVFWRHHPSSLFSRPLLDSGSRFAGMPSCPGGLWQWLHAWITEHSTSGRWGTGWVTVYRPGGSNPPLFF